MAVCVMSHFYSHNNVIFNGFIQDVPQVSLSRVEKSKRNGTIKNGRHQNKIKT